THALESAVGRAGALHLAAGIDGVHGLATALRRDLADLPEEDDHLPLPMGPGLGVTPVGAFDDQAPKRATPSSLELPNPLAAAAASRPHHVALVTESMAVSYAALATAAAERAAIAAGCGITPGMRVGLVGPREAEWAFWFHALGWLGAVVAPLDERAPASEQRRQREVLAVEHVIDTQAPPRCVVAPLPPRSWGLEEPRVVLATSGSTGTPRAVPLTTGQLLLSAFGSAIRLGHLPSDRWLCCLPLHHVGGLSILLRSVWYGITAVLHRRFEPTLVAEALDRGDASLVSLVPSMLERVLDARDMSKSQFVRFPSSLRAILLGGAAAPPSLLRRARALGAPVATTWGMTEAASQVATAFPGDIRLDGAVGPPLPFVAVDHQGARLALRGPLVRGHLVTGDRGVIDGEGRVVVQGRADAMIISGGENIDPSEVEQVLRRHPQVVDAAVVGLPSPIWGARPHALVMATGPITPDELAAHCRASLAGYKVPDRFELTPELPRTSLGKLARGEVARRLAATLPAELDPTFDALLGGVPQDQSDNPSPRAIER
ncbi:MAG: AMP-binding protein, partial [Myxococcales bacterium]|nr:AMP-binding protein [Myxococcales bacterium]